MTRPIDVERGGRMLEIRKALEMTQEDFADALNRAARELGLVEQYDYLYVSRRETARKKLEPEDFACIAMLDPQRRGWTWVAFGRAITMGKGARDVLARSIRHIGCQL